MVYYGNLPPSVEHILNDFLSSQHETMKVWNVISVLDFFKSAQILLFSFFLV